PSAILHPPSSILALSSGVKLLVYRLEPRLVDVGIDLRRRDIAVPEQLLDDAQVRPAPDQVRGEAVPKGVRRDVLEQSAAPPVLFNEHPEPDPLQRLAAAREE